MSNYEDEYQKWVSSLSPKDRAKLVAQGLDKPLMDDYEFDYDQFDKEEPISETQVDDKAKAYGSLLLCWVFQRLQSNRSEKNSTLERDTLLFALGLENLLVLKTQTAIAKRYGITRAGVSSRVKAWQKLLKIKPSALMKSETACKSYRKARLANLTKQR